MAILASISDVAAFYVPIGVAILALAKVKKKLWLLVFTPAFIIWLAFTLRLALAIAAAITNQHGGYAYAGYYTTSYNATNLLSLLLWVPWLIVNAIVAYKLLVTL